jgi:hypothetical protein
MHTKYDIPLDVEYQLIKRWQRMTTEGKSRKEGQQWQIDKIPRKKVKRIT